MSVCIGICRALYDYESQQPDASAEDRELSIAEGETLYVLERAEDGWWKVKKKAEGDEEEGQEGLVPANYVEEAAPIAQATAMYDYERQTTEELSLSEGAHVDIYDKEDSDWFLVGSGGQYGFAPSNYLEEGGSGGAARSPAIVAQSGVNHKQPEAVSLPPTQQPAAAQALLSKALATRAQPDFTDHTALESDHEDEPEPPRPARAERQVSQAREVAAVAPTQPTRPVQVQPASLPTRPQQAERASEPVAAAQPARRFATWPVQELEGKKKKRKGTLGLSDTEISWAPDRAQDTIVTWDITSLQTYSTEKKHVFIDLQAPPHGASFDFHAGSTEAAAEIGNRLGEMVGAARAPGIREVASALNAPLPEIPGSSGLAQRERDIGYPTREDESEDDFAAGAEVLPAGQFYATCLYDFEAQGDDEVTLRAGARVIVLDDSTSAEWTKVKSGRREGVVPAAYLESSAPRKAKKSKEERREEKAREKSRERSRSRAQSIDAPRAEKLKPQSTGKSKPDPNKVRTWTDRSKSFKVDAQLLGCSDGKIHLHKVNGVKISVPVAKMSEADIEYVEHKTGKVLREQKKEKPPMADTDAILDERERRRQERAAEAAKRLKESDNGFDWFDFFLVCGIDPGVCQRYTVAFERDNLGEQDIVDLTPELLRRLGVREGDILKIGRQVDAKLGRTKQTTGGGSLLTEADGSLKNNTRHAAQNVVDPSQLQFEDDAWSGQKAPAKPVRPQSTGAPAKAMEDLSLLDQPLIALPAEQQQQQQQQPAQSAAAPVAQAQPQMPQQTGYSQAQLQEQNIARIQQARAQMGVANQFAPQTQFGSAIVAHRTGGGSMATFQQPPIYGQQTGYQYIAAPAPFQDPFKTGAAAPCQDPFKTGGMGFAPQMTGYVPAQQTGFVPMQQTGFAPMMQQQQQQAPQQTGYMQPLQPQQTAFAAMQSSQQTGFNPAQPYAASGLPPFGMQPQQPMQTGFQQPMQTGFQQSVQQQQQQMPMQTGFNNIGGYSGFMQPAQPQPQMSAGMLKLQQMFTAAQQPQQSPGASPFGNAATQSFNGNGSGNAIGNGGMSNGAGGFQPIAFGQDPYARTQSAGPPPTGQARRANLNSASAQNPFGF